MRWILFSIKDTFEQHAVRMYWGIVKLEIKRVGKLVLMEIAVNRPTKDRLPTRKARHSIPQNLNFSILNGSIQH